MNSRIPVLWTNDDIHFGKSAELRRQLEFCDRQGIPGVFFVIPRQASGDLDQDEELLEVIGEAKQKGHEFYQHGYEHHAFECGVPDLAMLEVDRRAWRRFDENREALDAMHTLEAQVEMLEKGRRIWRRAFGEDSPGFRPGWGAFCSNFYKALSILGYEWVSSRLPCMTSFSWVAGHWGCPIDFRDGIPTKPLRLTPGVMEFPIAGDYGFRVPNDPKRVDEMVDLGLREFEVYAERGHPMLIVSHHHGLAHTGVGDQTPEPCAGGTGYAVHEKLIPALLGDGRAEFIGMEELVARFGKDAAT